MSRYVRALRFRGLTRFYDGLIATALRERELKSRLVKEAGIADGHRVLDVGSGTGTLALMIAAAAPGAEVIGVDGDPDVLEVAREKARASGSTASFVQGLAQDLPFSEGSFDRVVSSLVFHHLDPEMKRRALAEIRRVLRPGGELHVLDWGRARGPLMRLAFLAVQVFDGFASTRDNVAGRLPELMHGAGFERAAETGGTRTVFGTLCFYRAVKPTGSRRSSQFARRKPGSDAE